MNSKFNLQMANDKMDKAKFFTLIYYMIQKSRCLYNYDNRIFTLREWVGVRRQDPEIVYRLVKEGYLVETVDVNHRQHRAYHVTQKYCDELKKLTGKVLGMPAPKKMKVTDHKEIVRKHKIEAPQDYTSITRINKKIQIQKDLIVKYATSARYAIKRDELIKVARATITELEKKKKEMEIEKISKAIFEKDYDDDF